jgi:hypothetical protein
MHYRIRGRRRVLVPLAIAITTVALAACGSASSGSGTANSLLKQTFSGAHKVSSGNLNVTLTIDPSGSSTLSTPITLSFGGPFQSLGTGKLPQSNFNVSVSALGRNGSIGILSTGTSGYITLQGTSYRLPPATFKRLEASFSQLASSPGASSGSGALSKLGIQPLHWLSNPTVVGIESVGATQTTHIRATINVPAFLNDLNTFLGKASSLGGAGTTRIPNGLAPGTRARIAAKIQAPSFDVWTGNSDKTLRRLAIGLAVPVSGQVSTLLGGLRSAQIGLIMQYADLNQPQTITAPSTVRPYAEFTAKVRAFVQALSGTLGASGLLGGVGTSSSSGSGTTTSAGSETTGSTSAGSGTTGSASAGNLQRYSKCIQKAGSDIAKMQACAPLLGG